MIKYLMDKRSDTLRKFDLSTGAKARFDKKHQRWTDECCSHRACELTGDEEVSMERALQIAGTA